MPYASRQSARSDLPARVLADAAIVAGEVAATRRALVPLELPLQPRDGDDAERPAVVLVVSAAMADGGMHAVENRNARRHDLEVALAVRIRNVRLAARHDDHGAVNAGVDLGIALILEQPAVPNPNRRDARVVRRSVRHQAAAGHTHRGNVLDVHLVVEAAVAVLALRFEPVHGSDESRTVHHREAVRRRTATAGRRSATARRTSTATGRRSARARRWSAGRSRD